MSEIKVAPLVSVIMIFLNAEKFIEEAIESVLAQTYSQWELIFVDDGSSDESTQIAQRFAQQYPGKMRYFEHTSHQNRGMSASRNLGIKQSRGEYIAFLDADDIFLPQKLQEQVSILESHKEAAMVYGPTLHWYSWTGKAEDRERDHFRKLGVAPNTLVQPPAMIIRFLRHEAWTPGTCAVLIRRQIIDDVGGFEERFRGMLEDQVFFYKLCLKAPVFIDGSTWDYYRQHPESHYYQSLEKQIYKIHRPNPMHREFFLWLESYFLEQKVRDPELWTALNKKLFPYRHPVQYKIISVLHRLATLQKPRMTS